MITIRKAVENYLAMRRALGFKLVDQGAVLCQFVVFLEKEKAPFITTALALRWATQPFGSNQPGGPTASVSFVASHATGAPLIPVPKSHRWGFCLSATSVRCHTSIQMRKSKDCWKPPGICPHSLPYGVGPFPHSSDFWQ